MVSVGGRHVEVEHVDIEAPRKRECFHARQSARAEWKIAGQRLAGRSTSEGLLTSVNLETASWGGVHEARILVCRQRVMLWRHVFVAKIDQLCDFGIDGSMKGL
jgi:hypothetical protein